MKKYMLMIAGIVGVSLVGGAGAVYALFMSVPMSVTRQNSLPAAYYEEAQITEVASVIPTTNVR